MAEDMTRLRIDFGYDGGLFYGWAKQPGLRTVQGEFEGALARILRLPADDPQLRLTVAGRTDTGVHALHQVCHLDLPDERITSCVGHMDAAPVEALRRRLTRVLPQDIALHRVSVAPSGFDARFSALERTYVYRVCDAATPMDPRMRGFVLRVDDELDVDAMNEAAASTIGLHDFGSFATPNPGGTTIREVKAAHWDRVPTRPLIPPDADTRPDAADARYATPVAESGLLCFTIVADAFARNMVRSLVGACLRVGSGRRDVAWFRGKMAVPKREGESGPCPPQGLTLEHVAYPADHMLAERAEAIRAVRTL